MTENRLYIDNRAVDTVTNFTTLASGKRVQQSNPTAPFVTFQVVAIDCNMGLHNLFAPAYNP